MQRLKCYDQTLKYFLKFSYTFHIQGDYKQTLPTYESLTTIAFET